MKTFFLPLLLTTVCLFCLSSFAFPQKVPPFEELVRLVKQNLLYTVTQAELDECLAYYTDYEAIHSPQLYAQTIPHLIYVNDEVLALRVVLQMGTGVIEELWTFSASSPQIAKVHLREIWDDGSSDTPYSYTEYEGISPLIYKVTTVKDSVIREDCWNEYGKIKEGLSKEACIVEVSHTTRYQIQANGQILASKQEKP